MSDNNKRQAGPARTNATTPGTHNSAEPGQPPGQRRAVEYVRMSTENQRYSIDNQKTAIAAYARDHDLTVVRTYADSGKSGLTLTGRLALQRLLSDVLRPDRDFEVILVLDVSRWGRFQDPDQAAHYEYLCRAAGAQLCYCAEVFDNDGGLVSNVVKHIKRVMAAEYSRELSQKVLRAKLRQAHLGFRQGGSVSYGFRRMVVDGFGTPRVQLKAGQRKASQCDHVVAVPGPPEERAIVRRIFRLYVEEQASCCNVARRLNEAGVPTGTGRPWHHKRIAGMIRNELYIGYQIYNRRRHGGLRGARGVNPVTEQIRTKICKPIVPIGLFREANRLTLEGRWVKHSDAELLRRLRNLLEKAGRLSNELIDTSPDIPCATTYVTRFGSLRQVYTLIGYAPPPYRWRDNLGGYWTDAVILAGVRRLYETHGYVTQALVNRDPDLPGFTTVFRRFRTLRRCLELAGCALEPLDPLRGAPKRKARFPADRPAAPRSSS